MYANHKHYTLFILATIVFLVTTISFLYVRNGIYTRAFTVFDIERDVAMMEESIVRERDAQKTFTKIAEDQKKIGAYVVDTKNVVEFIKDVEEVGEITRTEMTLSNIQTKEVPQTNNIRDNFTKVEVGVVVIGGWSDVMRSLSLLENLPYSVVLDKLSLTEEVVDASKDKPRPKGKVWRLSVNIKALAL